ncbi:hypothetical protein NIES25_48320 [Nostoc linckia NIES-25]|nr:hypothetical protein NIES25_48320 [Nostoc linckia NIES-25]
MGHYSDISRGPELQDAYEKYQEWLKKPRAQKKAAYKTVAKPTTERVKVERVPGLILPFNSKNNNVYLEARVISSTQEGAGAATANVARGLTSDRFFLTLPTGTGNQSFDSPGYQFAKVIVSKRTTTATTESESRITGDTYKRHRSDNVSSAFGRKTSDDDYPTAVANIKAQSAYTNFVTGNANIGNRIGFKPEAN